MLPRSGLSALPSGRKLLLPDPSSSQVSSACEKGARYLECSWSTAYKSNQKHSCPGHSLLGSWFSPWHSCMWPDKVHEPQFHTSLHPHHCATLLTHPLEPSSSIPSSQKYFLRHPIPQLGLVLFFWAFPLCCLCIHFTPWVQSLLHYIAILSVSLNRLWAWFWIPVKKVDQFNWIVTMCQVGCKILHID